MAMATGANGTMIQRHVEKKAKPENGKFVA